MSATCRSGGWGVIQSLPQADMPFEGITAYLSQGDAHQIIFMKFEKDVELPEHAHAGQWGIDRYKAR